MSMALHIPYARTYDEAKNLGLAVIFYVDDLDNLGTTVIHLVKKNY